MMDRQKFWSIVAQAGWNKASHANWRQTKALVQRALRQQLPTVEDLKAFRAMFYELRAELGFAIEQYERSNDKFCGIGDDSFSDLLAHIIGLGQHVYDEAMANPGVAVARAQAGAFVESFSYTLPEEESYSIEGQEELKRTRLRDKTLTELEQHLRRQIAMTLESFGATADIENGWLDHAVTSAARSALIEFKNRKKKAED